jgi:tripartite-type tricarboxylate transporter receptor subunit TctC
MLRRLGFLLAGLLIAVSGAATTALAQDFPAKPVTLIVPWPPGGGSDIIMRMIQEPMSKALGQSVVIVNKPGAGGQIGLRETADAPPDGYTFSFISQQYNTQNANVLDDYTFLGWVGTDADAITAHSKTGWRTLDEFVAAAKANPGTIRNSNDQPGGSSYLAVALFERVLGIRLARIPYAGGAPGIQALLSGEVQTTSAPAQNMIEHHKAGTVRILAVAGDERNPGVPDVPTFKELGINVVSGTMRAFVAPKGLPADRAAKLEAAILAGLNDPQVRERFKTLALGHAPAGGAPALKMAKELDAKLYPILLEAGMVKFRKK